MREKNIAIKFAFITSYFRQNDTPPHICVTLGVIGANANSESAQIIFNTQIVLKFKLNPSVSVTDKALKKYYFAVNCDSQQKFKFKFSVFGKN